MADSKGVVVVDGSINEGIEQLAGGVFAAVEEESSPLGAGAGTVEHLDGSLERFLKIRDRARGAHDNVYAAEDGRDQAPGAAARRISELLADVKRVKSERDGYRVEIESLKTMVSGARNPPGGKTRAGMALEMYEGKDGCSTPAASAGGLPRTNGGKSPDSIPSPKSWADSLDEEENQKGARPWGGGRGNLPRGGASIRVGQQSNGAGAQKVVDERPVKHEDHRTSWGHQSHLLGDGAADSGAADQVQYGSGEADSEMVAKVFDGGPQRVDLGSGMKGSELPKRTWANVVVRDNRAAMKLEYIPPVKREGKIEVVAEEEGNLARWENCLVGYFLDGKLPYTMVKHNVSRLWSKEGLAEVLATDRGFYLFRFDNAENRDAILERGPWHVAGKLLVLKKWHKMLKLSKEALRKVPIWVKLYNLPLEFWTAKGLSQAASAIGVPLYVDLQTEQKKRISFARICVEVNAGEDLPISFDLISGGERVVIEVEYQWVPPQCTHCKVFGHADAQCRNQIKPQQRATQEKDVGHKRDGEWRVVKARGKAKVNEGFIESDKAEIVNLVCPSATPQVETTIMLKETQSFEELTPGTSEGGGSIPN